MRAPKEAVWRTVIKWLSYQQACNFMLSTAWIMSCTANGLKICGQRTWGGDIIAGSYGGSHDFVGRPGKKLSIMCICRSCGNLQNEWHCKAEML